MKKNIVKLFSYLMLLATMFLVACSSNTSESTPVPPPTEPVATAASATIAAKTDDVVSMEYSDAAGNMITLAGPAKRIISLAPSNTEILYAVSAGAQLVGRDSFSDFPAAALEVNDIGGGFGELNTELILSLNPDLVLAADITPPEQVQTLKDLGLTVYQLSNPTDLEGMYDNLRLVAEMTGHNAEPLILKLQARVTAVEAKIATVDTPVLVFYELDATDPNAPWTSGAGTFIDTLITMAGGENMGAVLADPWAQISVEDIVVANPEKILLGDAKWGGITPEMVAARPGWEGIAAVQNGEVYPFDDDLVSRPGPRLVLGLETLAALLHPDLFE